MSSQQFLWHVAHLGNYFCAARCTHAGIRWTSSYFIQRSAGHSDDSEKASSSTTRDLAPLLTRRAAATPGQASTNPSPDHGTPWKYTSPKPVTKSTRRRMHSTQTMCSNLSSVRLIYSLLPHDRAILHQNSEARTPHRSHAQSPLLKSALQPVTADCATAVLRSFGLQSRYAR